MTPEVTGWTILHHVLIQFLGIETSHLNIQIPYLYRYISIFHFYAGHVNTIDISRSMA